MRAGSPASGSASYTQTSPRIKRRMPDNGAGEANTVHTQHLVMPVILPPGVEHAISNTGLVHLGFLVATPPVTDDTKD
jgi:hypothetical protein